MTAQNVMLVFGRSGQVASELARQPLPRGWSLRALSRHEVDITRAADVRETVARVAPRAVINAAAYTAVDRAESEAELAFAVNCEGAAHIAAACAALGVPLLHISTDYVFDGRKTSPNREDDPVSPLSVYGRSKAAGEAAIRSRIEDFVVLRTSWVFSPFGRNFVRTMIGLADRAELRVVDDQRGAPTAAADIAHVLVTLAARLAEQPDPAAYGTFHYTGAGTTTWHGFAAEIFSALQARGRATPRLIAIEAKDYPAAARRPANSVLDCSRIAAVHGIRPRPWQAAVALCLEELLDQSPT